MSTTAFFKPFVLAVSTAIFLLQQYLNLRQHTRLVNVITRPTEIVPILSKEEFDKTRNYGIDRSTFGFVNSGKSFLIHSLFIYFDVYAWIWNIGGKFLSIASESKDWESTEIYHSLVYISIYILIETILQFPFNYYSTFVVEQRHGFNNQTVQLFFTDLVKSLALTVVIGYPCIAAFLWLVNSTGDSFYFYAWFFFLVLQIVLITIYPTLIQPLFNKVELLPDGELKSRIEALAKSVSFPLTKLFVIDGSKRSNHSNAYFYGFFKNKRIVLFDTLIDQVKSIDEIVAVLAHEIGHWFHSHTLSMLMISQIHTFILFFLFSLCHKNWDIYHNFGFGKSSIDSSYIPTLISFQLFLELYSPVDFVLSFLMNVLSRRFEFQADAYAKNLKMENQLVNALLKLSINNKGMLWPDPWYSAFNHSHPPVIERIKALGVKTFKTK